MNGHRLPGLHFDAVAAFIFPSIKSLVGSANQIAGILDSFAACDANADGDLERALSHRDESLQTEARSLSAIALARSKSLLE